MKTIKKLLTKGQDLIRNSRAEEIKREFNIAERDGKIYLIHSNVAFAVMSAHASANEIANKLNEARRIALELRGL